MGAAPGNRNSIRHGLTASRLPRGCGYIKRSIDEFRQHLEDLVLAEKGEINVVDAALINTVWRWERHAQLAQRWMFKAGDALKPVERLSFSREIAKASSARDAALQQLGLSKSGNDQWAKLYTLPPAATQPPSDAEGPTELEATADTGQPGRRPPIASQARQHCDRG